MVSQQHTNFLINTGRATAADLEELGEEVMRRVHDISGVWLEWEIERIGRPLAISESANAPSPPLGGERVGVRWAAVQRLRLPKATSPSHAGACPRAALCADPWGLGPPSPAVWERGLS
jgi:hypothetical protein